VGCGLSCAYSWLRGVVGNVQASAILSDREAREDKVLSSDYVGVCCAAAAQQRARELRVVQGLHVSKFTLGLRFFASFEFATELALVGWFARLELPHSSQCRLRRCPHSSLATSVS
jgi:hypothetical protein